MVETELRRVDGRVHFVVRTDMEAYASVLPRLAYAADGDGFVRRFDRFGPDIEQIYERFVDCIEELLEQIVLARPTPWEDALERTVSRLEAAGLDWFLVGSAALAVRGVDVAPGDIDIVTEDGEGTEDTFRDALIEPPVFDPTWIADWFGRAWLGARVEWAAAIHADLDTWRSPQESGPAARAALELVEWRGHVLPVTPLATQLAVSEHRGLHDRVAAIRRHRGDPAE